MDDTLSTGCNLRESCMPSRFDALPPIRQAFASRRCFLPFVFLMTGVRRLIGCLRPFVILPCIALCVCVCFVSRRRQPTVSSTAISSSLPKYWPGAAILACAASCRSPCRATAVSAFQVLENTITNEWPYKQEDLVPILAQQ